MTTLVNASVPGLGQWHREVIRLFDGFVQANGSEWTPRTDIFESEQGLSLQFDLPGIKREELDIRVEKDTLTVKGERKLASSPESYYRIERAHGGFNRSFSLPDFVNQEAIEAKMADGVLNIFMPRREETKPKQITVQVQ